MHRPIALVNTVAQESQQAGGTPPGGAVGAQAAFVRALVDAVESCHPGDRIVVSLREQLSEELTRLAQIIERSTGAPLEAEAQAADQSPIDVLAVDDDDDSLRATMIVLRRLGYPCRGARSGEEALREMDRQPAEIVLSDWRMPGMSGLDLCRALKRRERPPYVILVTAFHDQTRLLAGVSGGGDDFLRKPVDLDELEARLMAACRLIRALRTVNSMGERLRAEVRRDRDVGGNEG